MNDDALATTRLALHRVAAYVVSPARRHATGNEIALQVLPGGFGTPPFGNDEQVRVDGVRLVRRRGDREDAAGLTTLREAGRVAGVEPDLEWAAGFDIPPAGDLDAPLGIDADAAGRLAGWYALAAEALEVLRAEAGLVDGATAVVLWAEHFDVAIDLGAEADGRRATYGGSPGDASHPGPYLYVSPWTKRPGALWQDATFGGASVAEDALPGDRLAGALDFFRSARRELLGR